MLVDLYDFFLEIIVFFIKLFCYILLIVVIYVNGVDLVEGVFMFIVSRNWMNGNRSMREN